MVSSELNPIELETTHAFVNVELALQVFDTGLPA